MSGTRPNAPPFGAGARDINLEALIQSVMQNMPGIARTTQRVGNATTTAFNATRTLGRSTLDAGTARREAAVDYIRTAAQPSVEQIGRLQRSADRTLREQRAFTSAAGERVFDSTSIALEVFGIAGGVASQLVQPRGLPIFSILPGSAAAAEIYAFVQGENADPDELNGKRNPILVEYYIRERKDTAALQAGNHKVQRYLQYRHRSSAHGAAAGFISVVTGLVKGGKIGPFINAGLHGLPLVSTSVHLATMVSMRTRDGLDPRLKPWLNLLIEIKTTKALLRASLASLSLPQTDDSVWYQLIGASVLRLTHRPAILGACCVAAADLHARAHVEQGFAARAPSLAANAPGQTANPPTGGGAATPASFVNRAQSIPTTTGYSASQPATEIIVELFSKYGAQGNTDPMDLIQAPAGWIAIANKMMLM